MAALRETPFGRKNWILFGIGLATIVVGYLVLSVPPADGFLSLTLAPLLLVVGYCVLVPWAILAKEEEDQTPSTSRQS